MSGFLVGAALGGLVGAGLTALFATPAGEAARRELAARRAANAEGASAPTSEGDETSYTSIIDGKSSLLDLVAYAVGRVEDALEAARAASEEARQQLSQEWSESKRSGWVD